MLRKLKPFIAIQRKNDLNEMGKTRLRETAWLFDCGCERLLCDLMERERRLRFIKRIGRVQIESKVCDRLPRQNHSEAIIFLFQINNPEMHIYTECSGNVSVHFD